MCADEDLFLREWFYGESREVDHRCRLRDWDTSGAAVVWATVGSFCVSENFSPQDFFRSRA